MTDQGLNTGSPAAGLDQKVKARDLHYALIEHCGLPNNPSNNAKVRDIILAALASPSPVTAAESADLKAAKVVILDLCTVLEKYMEKGSFRSTNADDRAYGNACKWLSGAAEMMEPTPVVKESLTVAAGLESDLAAMDAFIADICHNGGQHAPDMDQWCETHKALWARLRAALSAPVPASTDAPVDGSKFAHKSSCSIGHFGLACDCGAAQPGPGLDEGESQKGIKAPGAANATHPDASPCAPSSIQPGSASTGAGREEEANLAICLGCGKIGVVLKAYRAPGPDAEADDECAECGSNDVYDTVEEAFEALFSNWGKRAASAPLQRAFGLEEAKKMVDEYACAVMWEHEYQSEQATKDAEAKREALISALSDAQRPGEAASAEPEQSSPVTPKLPVSQAPTGGREWWCHSCNDYRQVTMVMGDMLCASGCGHIIASYQDGAPGAREKGKEA